MIGLASDHAGFPLKQFVRQYLEENNIDYRDYGTFTEE
ncbi:MAG: RpiB/LacA/LacB family sugar-phosphate isomerase, partial [Bacteroidaceae bacterium]|nr:RpiB/LacA/LacB family sugar-phosphate isomerase [Bacteroidaceae bacterium]